VVREPDTGADGAAGSARAQLDLVGTGARVVVADGDAPRRAALLDELTQRLPERTRFVEASSVVQALELARGSRMVVIGGAVQGASASSLARSLARRHPDVHVVDLAAPTRSRR
jgi:DNA-binding NarL/FixJ family response regulator